MATLSEQGFDICLQAGATTWVVAGETEDNGARAVDIHGARAYHQTTFFGCSDSQSGCSLATVTHQPQNVSWWLLWNARSRAFVGKISMVFSGHQRLC
jgi:hypothetical protein